MILHQILAHKAKEVAERKRLYPTALLEKSIYFNTPTVSLAEYIQRPDLSGIIAEFKRKSPSNGYIRKYADPRDVTIGYMRSGASALSVLTDADFFAGKNEDLATARKFNFCPILRKDFVVDEYQIIEARSIGADAILLIAEALTATQVKQFTQTAQRLGLEVLLEVHSAEELEKFTPEVQLVGVNQRDLKAMKIDHEKALQLLPLLPPGVVPIAESGLQSPEEALSLYRAGYQGFLIGGSFMGSENPSAACARFAKLLIHEKQKADVLKN
jgi:indole-3-glycerol phosphate synthase